MNVMNAMQVKAGAKAQPNKLGTIVQPVQFIPRKEKDDEWSAWNIDFIEWEGLKQLRRKARRLSKNYKLANGTIDKTDYIVESDNDYKDIVGAITEGNNDVGALELKFFPIIPNVVNTLCSEFAKRNTKISFRAVDEFSYNEMLDEKTKQIGDVLLQQAEQEMVRKLMEQGVDIEDPQVQEQLQQQTSPDALKALPEIESYFTKTYRSSCEEWATHQHQVDEDRFMMQELEVRAFRDSLITDSEFWHFHMMEEDFDIELWNPMLTFYHKAPNQRYISQGHWVGKEDMMSVADVIDKYGHLMNETQMRSLELKYPVRAAGYPLQGYQHETYYDPTRSHEWNVDQPGLPMRQLTSMYNGYSNGVDIVDWITRQNEDYMGIGTNYLLRVCTVYWKSQRKVGYLTKIKESGETIVDIVDESYVVTDKPLFNNALIKNKDASTLLFGEFIEWIWINEVWGGVKIGPNFPTYWGMTNPAGISPLYLGINQNHVGPLKFQFKGDRTVYGCKLPVEGAVYSDYNTKSTSLVDRMKPFQVGYNIVNNQISDILVDELGTVIAFDPNMLPTHSLGEDWGGPGNYAKAWVAMKNFSVLPLRNPGLENGALPGGQAFQKLDLEQSARLMSRVNLANYFKQQAFEVIGVNAQRMGQQMGRQTATGVEENLNASYAQTENYFIQHSDWLMPRIHQMRTDLAQYYNSTKPSLRLSYITKKDERINFQINGTDLLARDINVFATSDPVSRGLMEQLKKMALENNTSGTSIFDLSDIVMSDSIAEINNKMRAVEKKQKADAELNHQREMEKIQADNDAALKEKQMQMEHDDMNKEKDRRNRILEAEIRSAGYAAGFDKDANQQSDFLDFIKQLNSSQEFQEAMNFEKSKESDRTSLHRDKLDIEREKIAATERLKQIDLDIATRNKNKYDVKQPAKKTVK